MLLGFNICAKHVLVWCFLSFFLSFPTSSYSSSSSSYSSSSSSTHSRCQQGLAVPCESRVPVVALPAGCPGIALQQEQGWSFDLRSEVGKEVSLQIPCQLVWLISSRAHSNKNQHLHNTWGHLGSTLQSVKDYVQASDAPVPGRGASDCKAQLKNLLVLLGWWLIPQWGIWVGLYLGYPGDGGRHPPTWVLITSKDCCGHTELKKLFKVIPKQTFMHIKEKAWSVISFAWNKRNLNIKSWLSFLCCWVPWRAWKHGELQHQAAMGIYLM